MAQRVRVAVVGHRGTLGKVVARRWAERGAAIATTDLRYQAKADDPLVTWAAEADLVVNCARGSFLVDALLPLHLGERSRLIQPSTDALQEDTPYALAKRIAERARALIIRTSLIGSDPPPPVGYTTWTWNGITTLAWADFAWAHREETGVLTPASDAISRYDLYCAVAETFGHAPPQPLATARRDRLLPPTHHLGPIQVQLLELREWSRRQDMT